MSEFQQLVQNSIPCARGVLQDNYRNLLQVADYCESNYEAAQDKRKALEETMAFATQSLASVACQISNLASDILKMLDLQATEVRKVEANVCSITQDQNTQLARTGTLARRGTKTSASQSSGSLGRSQRVPEPIRPPVIPDGKLSAASSSSSLSGPTGTSGGPGVSAPTEPPPPPPLPLPSLSPAFPPPTETDDVPLPTQEDILPPPPPVTMDDAPSLLLSDLDFPSSPPPPPLDLTNLEHPRPPLLPPPPPPEKLPWAPDTYLEKVVTLYPYAQQKGNELSFEEGTVIYMTRRYSDGWCEGVTSEGEGFFPGNYVEPLA
ncbi:ABI gene family member 3 isoform X3 [Hemicordylus capensis]|uniref:ABI gene family member 3 isoform X3 n=1 Tax=Hemicordylus capensis TaxID=884348 RepID=UPI002302D1F2|nr:ABI gene family member 3 isoform X3 [Hemicordylus capensis]